MTNKKSESQTISSGFKGANKRMLKDIRRLMKNLDKLSDQQVELLSITGDETDEKTDMWQSTFLFKPKEGFYKGGHFKVRIAVEPECYPATAPYVTILTPIYHPNMDSEEYDGSDRLDDDLTNTNVCLSLLDEWVESNDLEDCIQGLLFLFYHPNLDDPYSPYFDGSHEASGGDINHAMIEYERNVKLSLLGKEIDDWLSLPRNYHLDEEINLPELPPKPIQVIAEVDAPVIIPDECVRTSPNISPRSQLLKNILTVLHNIVRFWNTVNKWPYA